MLTIDNVRYETLTYCSHSFQTQTTVILLQEALRSLVYIRHFRPTRLLILGVNGSALFDCVDTASIRYVDDHTGCAWPFSKGKSRCVRYGRGFLRVPQN